MKTIKEKIGNILCTADLDEKEVTISVESGFTIVSDFVKLDDLIQFVNKIKKEME